MLCLVAAPVRSAVDLPNRTSATLAWDSAPGGTEAYAVYVAFGDAPFPLAPVAIVSENDRRFTVSGEFGDRFALRVAALDKNFDIGPTSPDSAQVCFLDEDSPRCGSAFDFDGTGPVELLWRNQFTDELAVTRLGANGSVEAPTNLPLSPDADWAFLGSADFDGDAHADLAWQIPDTRVVSMWLLRDNAIDETVHIDPILPPGWSMVGTGDFDGNGRDDLLWRHDASGWLAPWLMDGPTVVDAKLLSHPLPDWGVAATGDFDGDGKTDLLLRNPDLAGAMQMWFMNGVTVDRIENVAALAPPPWRIAGSADFDGDRSDDLLTQHESSAEIAVWLLEGSQIREVRFLGTHDDGWNVIGTGDYNADGRADILWRDPVARAAAIWFQNGLDTLGSSNLPGSQSLFNTLWDIVPD